MIRFTRARPKGLQMQRERRLALIDDPWLGGLAVLMTAVTAFGLIPAAGAAREEASEHLAAIGRERAALSASTADLQLLRRLDPRLEELSQAGVMSPLLPPDIVAAVLTASDQAGVTALDYDIRPEAEAEDPDASGLAGHHVALETDAMDPDRLAVWLAALRDTLPGVVDIRHVDQDPAAQRPLRVDLVVLTLATDL